MWYTMWLDIHTVILYTGTVSLVCSVDGYTICYVCYVDGYAIFYVCYVDGYTICCVCYVDGYAICCMLCIRLEWFFIFVEF